MQSLDDMENNRLLLFIVRARKTDETETLLGVVEVVEMFPVEVANEGENGAVVGRTDVDGVRQVACRNIGGQTRSRRRRRWGRPAEGGRGRRQRGRLDGARYDDRHVKRAGERLERWDRQVAGDAEHREDAASDRQAFYSHTPETTGHIPAWTFSPGRRTEDRHLLQKSAQSKREQASTHKSANSCRHCIFAVSWLRKPLRTEKPASAAALAEGKWRMKKLVSLTWLVRRSIAAGKTQRCLLTQQAAILRSVWRPIQTCFFVHRDLDLWPFNSKISGFPGLIVEHFYVSFGVPIAASVFEISCGKQTDTQTNGGKNPTPATAVR